MSTSSPIWRDRFRYVLLILGFLCLTSICSNYIIINFTFICMANDASDIIEVGNGTFINRFDYTPAEKSSIIWAVAIGTILGTFPINYCYIRFGARLVLWPFFISGVLSALSTAFIPVAAYFGLPFLLFSRFVQGLAYAADFAAIGILCVRWAPLSQTGIFISVLTTFTPVSTVITNPLSGWVGFRMLAHG
ncbi:hypothetical protein OESDEN_08002 [Oesophagostomum dentatum]|uniref:Major facilitator superfamily (MFS) profile domain-containing protein n=1 Tax=Oesophagostomum dentatum TaxID=61180 RepID=A0A0B1T9U3_OESDE|nr:hypothetical protein OESDEN_08002 [Oesophagostomum dentatum]